MKWILERTKVTRSWGRNEKVYMIECSECGKEKEYKEIGMVSYYELDEPPVCKDCVSKLYGDSWNPFTGKNDLGKNRKTVC